MNTICLLTRWLFARMVGFNPQYIRQILYHYTLLVTLEFVTPVDPTSYSVRPEDEVFKDSQIMWVLDELKNM